MPQLENGRFLAKFSLVTMNTKLLSGDHRGGVNNLVARTARLPSHEENIPGRPFEFGFLGGVRRTADSSAALRNDKQKNRQPQGQRQKQKILTPKFIQSFIREINVPTQFFWG
jgi:hypothetical protein